MTIGPDQAASVYIGAFVDELNRAGVRHVCIAPGSRSAPLALTIAANPALRTWMHLDERVAAFFALGLARMTEVPVALLCTSGTAAANFLPAIVEAQAAGIPLLVLTADRPPELRDVGAAQTNSSRLRLDDRWEEVRRGRSRCTQQRDRQFSHPCKPEGEERSDPLVEVHPGSQRRIRRDGQGEWRRA